MNPPDAKFEAALATLAADRESGADEIARRARHLLAEQAAHATDPDAWPATLAAAGRIAACRPAMAGIAGGAARLLDQLAGHRAKWEGRSADQVWQLTAILEQELLQEREELIGHARTIVARHGRVVTLSWSSTIHDILASGEAEGVTVLECRPDLEGRRMVERLASAGVVVQLATEAQMAGHLSRAELLLVGADTVHGDGSIVNRIGTHTAALCAQGVGVPVVAAADTGKLHPWRDAAGAILEAGAPEAVWPEHPERCSNPVFDVTPGALVTTWVSQKGPMAAAARRDATAEAARLWQPLSGQPFSPDAL